MKIVHTEASLGWGGQEIRTFNEAVALRDKGHEVFFIIQKGAKLAHHCKKAGFTVLEVNFFKKYWLFSLPKILGFLKAHNIQLIVTHSSLDAWLGGIAARFLKIAVVRIRHVSTPTKAGLNAKILFDYLADEIITTSTEIIEPLAAASGKKLDKIKCIPTGVNPDQLSVDPDEVESFKKSLGFGAEDFIVGSVCVVRSWKGIDSLIGAADKLREVSHLKWLIVGGGYLEQHQKRVKELKLEDKVIFTGHIDNPKVAMASLDVFILLSTSNEGISQASLQASFLQKPLVTTPIGGLKEVCVHEKTGLIVSPHSPDEVACAIMRLKNRPEELQAFGKAAKKLILERFLFEKTLQQVEEVYKRCPC